ncbi:Fur family transcriptional regulator [Kitasatospora aureofaciens]|uniref:Fur family transcriptional regulator n=1 Tax=Kitasatospora aureofaciens TaxID=1894 RepID=UPI001C482877|nr:Fur family transcriptional regulator [Kitasatospora aureofaciens]MBV6697762.1 transcriptional repressor [Kitasatospora aureofaciens]
MPRTRRIPVPPWRDTPQRLQVLRALAARPGFSSAKLLHARMAADGCEVGLSTVYRALAALVEAGQADVVRDDNGERLFRHRGEEQHQHYLVCRHCGFALALDTDEIETWADRIARESGFADVRHTVELAGVCTECSAGPL